MATAVGKELDDEATDDDDGAGVDDVDDDDHSKDETMEVTRDKSVGAGATGAATTGKTGSASNTALKTMNKNTPGELHVRRNALCHLH